MTRELPRIDLLDDMLVNLYRRMTPQEKFALACRLGTLYGRQWRESLRRQFPGASEEEFRIIVMGRLLEEGDEERQIAARCAKRCKDRAEFEEMIGPSTYSAGC